MSDYDVFPYLNLLFEQGGSDMYLVSALYRK